MQEPDPVDWAVVIPFWAFWACLVLYLLSLLTGCAEIAWKQDLRDSLLDQAERAREAQIYLGRVGDSLCRVERSQCPEPICEAWKTCLQRRDEWLLPAGKVLEGIDAICTRGLGSVESGDRPTAERASALSLKLYDQLTTAVQSFGLTLP